MKEIDVAKKTKSNQEFRDFTETFCNTSNAIESLLSVKSQCVFIIRRVASNTYTAIIAYLDTAAGQ